MNNSAPNRGVGISFDGDLRAALLNSAVALIATSGVDHVSLRGVARHAGVSHAAPAHHFGDKAGLLTALATDGFELFTQSLRAAADVPVGTDALTHLGQAYLNFSQQHPGHFDVMFRTNMINTSDTRFEQATAAAFAELKNQVTHHQTAGWHAEEDTTHLAAASWALVHGLSVLQASGSLPRVLGDSAPDNLMDVASTLTGRDRN